MAANGGQTLTVRFVQVFLYPLFVHLIGTAVFGQRVHITGLLLKAFQVLRMVIYKDILVIDMVTGKQYAHRRSERQTAVATVGGQLFVT